jgi:hypothetical protein
MLVRQRLRPYGMIERARKTSITARAHLERADTSSFARRVVFTNDGDKIARNVTRAASGGGGGGGGGGSGPPPGGGSWP